MRMWTLVAYVLLVILPRRLLARFHCQRTESLKGYRLAGLSFHRYKTRDIWSCFLRCEETPLCQSMNYNLETSRCEHNNRTRASRPSQFIPSKGTVYFDNPLRATLGSSTALYGLSCKEIKYSSPTATSGEYLVDPLLSGKPFTVFCDMETDGGGWTLLAQTVIKNLKTANTRLTKETNYRQIGNYTNNDVRVDVSAISQLQRGLEFRQLRYYCYRQSVGRSVHIMTTINSLGYAVVRYFVFDPSRQPTACGSFMKLPDDTSILATKCSKWGDDGKNGECNKWGHFVNNSTYRIYHMPAFWRDKYYYSAMPSGLLCDENNGDNNTLSIGDSWKVFVR